MATKPIRHDKSFETSGSASSYTDLSGAYLDLDAGGTFAQVGGKGPGSIGLKLRTVLAGVALTVLTFTSTGAATFLENVTMSTGKTFAAQAVTTTTIVASGTVSSPGFTLTGSSGVVGFAANNITISNSGDAIIFNTAANTEAARFNANRQFIVGATAVPSATVQGVMIAPGSSSMISSQGAASSAYNHWLFMNTNGIVGSISTSGSTTSYTTTSDIRRKTDRGIATSVDVLRAIVIHDFDWTVDGTRDRGVFAQEAHRVPGINPHAVHVGVGGAPWGFDYSKMVPDLIVGWQNHEARLAKLEQQES